ncbi:MAG: hypothetical protein ACYTGP_08425, partial [Planctomycetota bacterium]
MHTRVSVGFDHVPAREAVRQFAAALEVPIIGRYEDDRAGHGLDPTMPITFRLEEGSALDALEMILDQAALFDATTWQLRDGFLEVGTKRRLSRTARRQHYDLSDLLLEAPYFASDGGAKVDFEHFTKHPYRSASLKVTWGSLLRQNPQQLLEELI